MVALSRYRHMAELTEEREDGGEDEEHPVAAHGEGEGKVSCQAAPGEEVVDSRPVVGVQKQLEDRAFDSSLLL